MVYQGNVYGKLLLLIRNQLKSFYCLQKNSKFGLHKRICTIVHLKELRQ